MSDVLVWTDIETTGLDPEADVILEVGMTATGWDLRPVTGVGDLRMVVRPDRDYSRLMEGAALAMHTANHLLYEASRSPYDRTDMTVAVHTWLHALHERAHADRMMLAGSSVHFDRGFLTRLHDPTSNITALAGVDHRLIDVSVLDEIARHQYPDIHEHRPKRTTNHRVTHCLHDSMTLYRYYLDNLIGAGDQTRQLRSQDGTVGR